jgi:hypothetical protein
MEEHIVLSVTEASANDCDASPLIRRAIDMTRPKRKPRTRVPTPPAAPAEESAPPRARHRRPDDDAQPDWTEDDEADRWISERIADDIQRE